MVKKQRRREKKDTEALSVADFLNSYMVEASRPRDRVGLVLVIICWTWSDGT